MSRTQFARRNHVDHFRSQRQQPQRIRDRRTGFTDTFRKFFLRQMVFIHQLFHRVCGFDRVQIFTLQVFDQRDLLDLAIRIRTNHDRDLCFPCDLRRTVTPFTGDDHIFAVFEIVHDDRHDQSVFFDGIRQLVQSIFIKILSRLVGIRPYQVDIHFHQPFYIFGKRCLRFIFGNIRLFRRIFIRLFRIRKQRRQSPS